MTLQETIKHYLSFFSVKIRENGTSYAVIDLHNRPEELYDSIRKAHGDRFPDDFIYKTYMNILERLTEYELNTIDDVDNIRGELVDGMVDIYTNDLTKWLHDDINNVYYLTDVIEQFEPKDGFQLLSMAQYQAIDEVFSEVYNLLSGVKYE